VRVNAVCPGWVKTEMEQSEILAMEEHPGTVLGQQDMWATRVWLLVLVHLERTSTR
jgi:NAD(P)-dependent dehydrogenase (short-subunit alcohol dehydrogenase family)